MFDKRVPGGLHNANDQSGKIKNQFTTIQNRLGNKIVPGGTCGARLQNELVYLPLVLGLYTDIGDQ